VSSQPPSPPTSAPEEPAPQLDLEALVAPLLGKTFELRRAYEHKQRVLTELQHEIDVVRMSTTPFARRRQGIDNLEHHFRELAKAAEDAEELFKAIRNEFDGVHQEAHEIERRQRQL
jgi:hypothetical protein